MAKTETAKEFTGATVRHLRVELQLRLDALGEELGLRLHLGNAKYLGQVCTFSLEASYQNADGQAKTKIAQDFELLAKVYGLLPSDLGRTFTHHGQLYTVVGLLPRSRKFPIVCERGGAQYKLEAQRVARMLHAQVQKTG